MAKKVQGTHVEHKVTTKGLKEVEKDAKKAGKGFNTLDKNARSADRGMKGAANMSSGASKNFSKLSQGITGGLVPAYATLAANLFALDAVFRFLKDSADFRVLREGQLAFAASTGVAYTSLARDIQAATNGMINFRDAAQAGAIGRAAGLSASQLKELSGAARTVSIALGRDVTDSFNRLVRGVTKAEPELLDELGIILRLDEATTKYAASLGLNKNQLSIYQKSQAVVNEVLGQAETKFGKINQIMAIQDNSITQLGVAFEEAIDKMRPFIAGIAEFFARFGAANIDVLTFAIIGFAGGIVKSVIPATHELRAAEKARSEDFIAQQDRIKIKLEEVRQKKLQLANTPIAQQNFGLFAQQQGLAFGGKTGEMLARGEALSGQQIGNLKSQLKRKGGPIGAFKNLDDKQLGIAEGLLDDMKKDGGKMSKATRLKLQELGLGFEELGLKGKKGLDSIVSGFERMAGGALRALSVISTIVAVGSILFMIGKAIYNFIRRDDIKRTEAFNKKLEESQQSARRLNDELMKMGEVVQKNLLDPGAEKDIFIGNAIESADIEGRLRTLDQLAEQADLNAEGFAAFQQELAFTFQNLRDINPEFEKFSDELRDTGTITPQARKELKILTDRLLTVKAAQDTLNQTSGEYVKAQNRLIQSLPKVPYQDIIELLNTQQRAYKDLVKSGQNYELHLQRVTNQLEIYTIFQKNALKLQEAQANLDADNAIFGALAGDTTARRMLKVRQATLAVEKEIQKLNELQLNIKTAELEGDDQKLKALLQQRDAQVAMVVKAENLLRLEKMRADQMAMTVNTVYGNLEKDLGQALGAAMRGDSSGFEKIGQNMAKTITDALGQFLAEQFIEDVMPDFMKPTSVGEEIKEAGNKHAEVIKEAIKDGAMLHGRILKGENETLNSIFEEQKKLNAQIAAADAAMTEDKIARLTIEKENMELKTTGPGILQFSKTAQFEKEAIDFEFRQRDPDEQRTFNEAKQTIKDATDVINKYRFADRSRVVDTKPNIFYTGDPAGFESPLDEITVGDLVKNAQNEIARAKQKQNKIIGDYRKEYEEYLNNNKTIAIQTRDDLQDSIIGLTETKNLQLTRAGIYGTPDKPETEKPKIDLSNLQFTVPKNFNFDSFMSSKRAPGGFNLPSADELASNVSQRVFFDPNTGALVVSTPNMMGKIAQSLGVHDPLNPEQNDITPAAGTTEKKGIDVDQFSKGLNQFSGVIGMMGALTGKEEKTAEIMAKVAKIQLLVAMYERAKMAFEQGGGVFSILKSFMFGSPTGRQGGIMSKHGRSYAHGGIAEGPSSGYGAILHGREAVVPLPNGRAIPVEMAGGGKMNTNNTNITVNIDDSGTTGKVDTDGGAELGNAINMAVQSELEKQMRPGGILAG
tara:strand:+ start:1218 stop:5357 length:4140 start_codon:yes stop_codon:yes gene_type:complete